MKKKWGVRARIAQTPCNLILKHNMYVGFTHFIKTLFFSQMCEVGLMLRKIVNS